MEIAVSGLPAGEDVALATALRRAVLTIDVADAPGIGVTASIGTATTHRSGYDTATVSLAARTACDDAVAQGGNRVVAESAGGGLLGALTASGAGLHHRG